MSTFPFPRSHPMHPPSLDVEPEQAASLPRVKLWNNQTAWLITNYADVRSGLSDNRLSADSKKPGYPHTSAANTIARQILPNFLLMDDPEHRRIRNACGPNFKPKGARMRSADILAIVEAQVDHLLECDEPVDLQAEFSQAIPALVVSATLGVDPSLNDELLELVLVVLLNDSTPEDAVAASEALIEVLRKSIEHKRTNLGNDVISHLIGELDKGVLTQLELLGAMRQIFVAAQESTVSNMTLGVLLLLDHPDQLKTLIEADDQKLWSAAADEIVRFTTVSHFGRRRVAIEDLVIGGQLVRAGEGVILAENFANRDPDIFPNPNEFDISRRNAGVHLGFGAGTHHCLGVHLARAELSISLSTLFRRIPTLRLATSFDNLIFREDITVYSVESLPVAWS